MKIRIISTLKIENKFTIEAMKEYKKRLGPYCKIEFKQSKNPANEIFEKSYVIKIDSKGDSFTSEEFASKIDKMRSNSDIVILLNETENVNIDYKLSISKMDFPLDIMLVILHEQIYRAFRIITNSPYHK